MDGPYRATKLWNEMLHTFKHGMPLKRHRRHMRIYESCFTGAEAVNWLQIALKENPNIKPGISKNQVRQLLNKFLKAGVFCSVCGTGENQEFKESEVYRFSAHALLLHTTAEVPRNDSTSNLQDVPKPMDVASVGNRVPMFNIANCNDNMKKMADSQNLKNSLTDVTANRLLCSSKEPYMCTGRIPTKSCSGEHITANKHPGFSSQMPNANFPVLQVPNTSHTSKPYRSKESHVGVTFPGGYSDRYDVTQNINFQQTYLPHEANAYLRNLATTSAPPEKHGYINAHKPHRSPYEFACHKVSNVKLEAPQFYQDNIGVRLPSVVNYGMNYRRIPNVGNHENSSIVAPMKPPRAHQIVNMENKFNLPQKPLKVQNSVNMVPMHDARRIHHSNSYRRNTAAKMTSDNSSQFPPSEIDGCPKYFIEDKHYSSGEHNGMREISSDSNRVVSRSSAADTDVFDALNMAFVLRLETVLAGMEEIAALLPSNIRMDWLIRNVLEQSEKFKRSASIDSGLDERPEEMISNFREELTGFAEPLVNIELYSIIAETFLYVEHINAASKQFICKARDTIPTTRSIENLVLGMASPSVSSGKSRTSTSKERMLPTSYCYETAFASDTPITRIIPQCTMETVHLTRRGMSRSFRSSRERTSTSDGRVHEAGVMKRNASLSHMPPASDRAGVVWRSKSSQDVKEFEDDFVNTANPNHCVHPNEKAHSRRQRSWRINKKHGESKEKSSGLQHCRNKSGGYVNPALSQSWEDLSQSLCSNEFDYAAALESLQTLMRNTTEIESHSQGNKNAETGDVSSESSSYHTAASTPDRQKYSNASLTKEHEQRKWKQPALGLGISIFQLILLLLPPSNRCSLKRLLRCLHNLPTAIDISETYQIIQSMTPKILAYEDERDKSLPFRIVKFLVTFYKEIFEIPSGIHSEVLKHLPPTTLNQKMTYCEQVTRKQFTEQGLSSSQKALSELLEQIVKDSRMSEKEKKRKLKMFRERYPDIYRQHFPGNDSDRVTSDKSRGLLQLPSFGKRKNIRV